MHISWIRWFFSVLKKYMNVDNCNLVNLKILGQNSVVVIYTMICVRSFLHDSSEFFRKYIYNGKSIS